jgi:hypothetical protein
MEFIERLLGKDGEYGDELVDAREVHKCVMEHVALHGVDPDFGPSNVDTDYKGWLRTEVWQRGLVDSGEDFLDCDGITPKGGQYLSRAVALDLLCPLRTSTGHAVRQYLIDLADFSRAMGYTKHDPFDVLRANAVEIQVEKEEED